MKKINIKKYGKIKLVSYKPLCINRYGLNAIEKHKCLPFIDHSCRREPDLENKYPSISALCRKGMFAPHLSIHDIIVYITVKSNYYQSKKAHHRLVAILQVKKKVNTHKEAEKWYEERNIDLPSNCMVKKNRPVPLHETICNYKNKGGSIKCFNICKKPHSSTKFVFLKKWDQYYKNIVKEKKHRKFIITKSIYKELSFPMPIHKTDIKRIFGKHPPGTQNPRDTISKDEFKKIAKLIGLKIILGKQMDPEN